MQGRAGLVDYNNDQLSYRNMLAKYCIAYAVDSIENTRESTQKAIAASNVANVPISLCQMM